jgi:hypothetical protein
MPSPAFNNDPLTAISDKLHISKLSASGAFKSLNPTNVQFHVRFKGSDEEKKSDAEDAELKSRNSSEDRPDLALLWRARDNRKGRNSIVIPRGSSSSSSFKYTPRFTSSLKEVGSNVRRMFTTFPYWDMSYGVGMAYTIGSVVWVMNGFFVWLPIAYPNTEFSTETDAGGITAFIGVTCFEIGAGLALLEAINDGSFHGSAMRRLLDGREEDQKKMVDEKIQNFFRHAKPRRRNRDEEEVQERADNVDPQEGWDTKHLEDEGPDPTFPPDKEAPPRRGAMDLGADEGESSEYYVFRWLPTWHSLKSHHVHEIGFLACLTQFIGATVFLMSGIVGLPPITTKLTEGQLNGLYWAPQIVASFLFVCSSVMFLLETQEKWYKPNPKVLGWWIGLFSTIGSLGFE